MKKFSLYHTILTLIIASIFCAPAFDSQRLAFSLDDYLVAVDLQVENYPDTARIVLRTNRYFEYFDYHPEEGRASIIFDPLEPLYVNIVNVDFDKKGIIKDIRLIKGLVKTKAMPAILKEGFYPLDYIVIDLNGDNDYSISQRADLIVIDIGKKRLPPVKALAGQTLIEKLNVSLPEPKKMFAEAPSPQPVQSEPIKEIEKPAAGPEPKLVKGSALNRSEATDSGPQEPLQSGETFSQLRDEIISKANDVKRLELPKGKIIFNYRDCLEMGTVNFVPLLIAEEEIRLNDLKVNEANRGLYPTATAKYTTTNGKTFEQGFTEKTYGMQVDQPLYYGGRLRLSLKQAQINREVAKAKYDKTESEIVSKVTETFYNMATAQLNLDDQQDLAKSSKEILATVQKKYESELVTKLELLNVQSQCNQIDYQLSVAAKDFEMARTNLLQTLGVDPSANILVDFSLDYKEYDININKCLALAYQSRPELHMNELLYKASEIEEKIAKSKDALKVDISGFLGESGSAYHTETLDMGTDWFIGLKASKPWMGNTGSYSYTQNKTSPKLGQDTRTEGLSNSFEFGILNNLTGYSERQSAFINKLKAENELIEIEKTVNLEVREAYNNYQKAVLQMQNTQDKIKFREEELKVLRFQADLNEVPLSQVLDSLIKLNDEKALYHQAIASYKTALSNLSKAIGLVGYFK